VADPTSPRSRRSLLAAAGTAAAAAAAASLTVPLHAAAAPLDYVRVDLNALTGTGTTGITSTVDGVTLRATNTAPGGVTTGTAILGQADGLGGWGVHGHATALNGYGVYGVADGTGGYGVAGSSNALTSNGAGVKGLSRSPDGAAVTADAINGGIGVRGLAWGGSPDEVPASPMTGVFGYAPVDATSRGVSGLAVAGEGVRGEAASGIGVHAVATTGTALAVTGKASLSRSGKANVAKGKKSVDIEVPGGITADTIITATIQAYRGTTAVACVRPNYPSAGKARIYLTKVGSYTASTPIGWVALEHGA
jgi:hypothetical protein